MTPTDPRFAAQVVQVAVAGLAAEVRELVRDQPDPVAALGQVLDLTLMQLSILAGTVQALAERVPAEVHAAAADDVEPAPITPTSPED